MFDKKELIRTSSSKKYYRYRNALLNANISFYVKKKKSRIFTRTAGYRYYAIYVSKNDYEKAKTIIKNATK